MQTGVIGQGIMGRGIATLLVSKGLPCISVGRRADALPEVRQRIESDARAMVKRRRAKEDAVEAGLDALTVTDDDNALAHCDMVVEAITEDFDAKVALLTRLGRVAAEGASLATNTSSFSVRALAAASGVGARLAGMHFMNPVPASRMVEVVHWDGVDPACINRAGELAGLCRLTAVPVADAPGFVVNRVLMPMIAEAVRAVEAGVASAADVDGAMRLACGHPMGPLAIADLIGLDVVLKEMEEMARELGPRFEPPERLRELVREGKLGRKTGAGLLQP